MSMDQISEEDCNEVVLEPVNANEFLSIIDEDIFEPDYQNLYSNGGPDFWLELLGFDDPSTEPVEISTDTTINEPQEFGFEQQTNLALSSPEPLTKRYKQAILQGKPVPLSHSVAVGEPQNGMEFAHSISLIHPLEETFRPRYKSDYFAQNGRKRRPRYVADRKGNHFISIKVPSGSGGRIRVDWLTTRDEFGDRYSMPYRFQMSNESFDVADCNPGYWQIEPNSNGLMKLYLVLIKAKQDELKSVQPLKPFRPLKDAFGVPDDIYTKSPIRLTPKKLIETYHLTTSQLAFTYCGTSIDGKPIPEWNTTVYSTVMTEVSPETSKQKNVSCPRCSCVFQPPSNDRNEDDDIFAPPSLPTKRKTDEYSNDIQSPSMKKRT